MNNTSNPNEETSLVSIPPWVAPPIDAWTAHYWKLLSLFIYYIICFIIGQFVNWLCLLNINKTNLTSSARYLMILQCIFNTSYITINFPYKATILFLQRTFLPRSLKIFCGWLHLWAVFGSMFLQDVMAITRVIYIIFPHLANKWFQTTKSSLIPVFFPIMFGCLYSIPSLHPCCYRFYKFTSYAMSYVGYDKQVQLQFSVTGSSLLVFTLITCYTSVFFKIRKSSRTVTTERQRQKRQDTKKETRLSLLFGVTGCVWFVYLTIFYTIYWSGLFKPYSYLVLGNEMLEQVLFFIDPVVYIFMSSELRRSVLKFFGVKVPAGPVTTRAATTRQPGAVSGKFTPKQGGTGTAWTYVRNSHPKTDTLPTIS